MSAPLAVPKFAILAAALRKTTERLAADVVESSPSPPDWNELEWTIAQAAAAMQGVSPLLASSLAWSGPPRWRAFLAEQRAQSILRDASIGTLLEQVDASLRHFEISCVALKGAAIRKLGVYGPGERPMGDIDLLVATADLARIGAALAEIGYVEAFTMQRHRVYEPRSKKAPHLFGEHVDNPLKIEIHTAVAEALPAYRIDITARLGSPDLPGLNDYRSRAALFLHLLLHAAGNMRAHALRQLQLHDIAIIAPLLRSQEWEALLAPGGDTIWWLFPPLALTARYYRGSIPEDAVRAARAACPRVLRRTAERQTLTDVSWSNLRIHAFPGIAWARTPLEALRFMRSRVVPSRRAFAELELAQRALPQLEQVPWYNRSHGSRILRWVFTRPPRVQTIASVCAALQAAHAGVAKAVD